VRACARDVDEATVEDDERVQEARPVQHAAGARGQQQQLAQPRGRLRPLTHRKGGQLVREAPSLTHTHTYMHARTWPLPFFVYGATRQAPSAPSPRHRPTRRARSATTALRPDAS
jgi:hypothetical protein